MPDETRYDFKGHIIRKAKQRNREEWQEAIVHYFFGTKSQFDQWKNNNQEKFNRWREEIAAGFIVSVKITRQEVNADKRPIGEEEVVFPAS